MGRVTYSTQNIAMKLSLRLNIDCQIDQVPLPGVLNPKHPQDKFFWSQKPPINSTTIALIPEKPLLNQMARILLIQATTTKRKLLSLSPSMSRGSTGWPLKPRNVINIFPQFTQ